MADPKSKEQKIIDRALKNLKRAVDAVQHNYVAAVDDLRFANGEQWDNAEKQRRSRSGRPALTVNLLPKYIDQVTGDMRHNCPQIKLRPVDARADVHMAKIREGLINQIQYNSNARDIYVHGGEMQVRSGYGAWRVLTRWCDDNPFQQEIYLESVKNPFLVYMDPDCKDLNYADARFAFIMEKMPKAEFERRYPDAEIPGDNFKVAQGLGQEMWYDKDSVTVAEYFEKVTETVTMCQMEDGTYMTEDEYKEATKQWEVDTQEIVQQVMAAPAPPLPGIMQNLNNPAPPPPGTPEAMAPQAITPQGAPPQAPPAPPQGMAPPQAPQGMAPPQAPQIPITPKPKVVKRRELDRPVIKHYVMSCIEILNKKKDRKNEPEDKWLDKTADIIPGDFIPLILVRGKIINVEGKEFVQSLIRNGKDMQKLVNYWHCLSLDTKIPTPTGWTTMGDIQMGDSVFDEEGNVCEVLGVSPVNTDRKCFRITFDDGSVILTDDGHKWKVEERVKNYSDRWAEKIVTSEELKKGRHIFKLPKPLQLPEADLPMHPYALGVWLGDGASATPRISVGRRDVVDSLAIMDSFGIETSGLNHDKQNVYYYTFPGATPTLRELGVLNNKHIPKQYLRASYEQRLQLLQGLLDTDGSIHSKSFSCVFTTTIPQLAEDYAELVRSLGLKASCIKRNGRVVDFGAYSSIGKDQYQFNFMAPLDMDVFRLPRKLAVQKSKVHNKERHYKRYRIKNIEIIDSIPTKCIMVSSESHLFLAGEMMIPTHNTTAAETIALSPKTPWIGTAKHFEGYEADYANANVENIPYLKYNVDPEAPTGPQKIPVAQPPQGVFQQIAIAESNLKSVIGMFNADVGDAGPERTGAAILARQAPGDISTFVFMDHLASAIAHTGRIINSMIPYIYDTERDIRLRGVDDAESFVPVNTTLKEVVRNVREHPERYSGLDKNRIMEALKKYGPNTKFNDITAGKYDVFSTVGPSYATQRAEAADMLFKMFNSMPQQMSLAADLIVENLDFKDADKLARRLRKTLPPNIVEQREGEVVQQQPNPAMIMQQMKMQADNAKVQMAQMKLEVEKLKLEREKIKLQAEIDKIRMEVAKASTGDERDKELSRLMDAMEKDRRYDLELERLRLEEARLEHQKAMDGGRLALDASNQTMEMFRSE